MKTMENNVRNGQNEFSLSFVSNRIDSIANNQSYFTFARKAKKIACLDTNSMLKIIYRSRTPRQPKNWSKKHETLTTDNEANCSMNYKMKWFRFYFAIFLFNFVNWLVSRRALVRLAAHMCVHSQTANCLWFFWFCLFSYFYFFSQTRFGIEKERERTVKLLLRPSFVCRCNYIKSKKKKWEYLTIIKSIAYA